MADFIIIGVGDLPSIKQLLQQDAVALANAAKTQTMVLDSISDILKEMVIFEAQMDYLEARQKATKPFDRHTGMKPRSLNLSRPVTRPMRSVNRNR